jgi:hypothetical protein
MVMRMQFENRMVSAEWLKAKCYEICDEYNTEHLYIDRIIDEIDNAPDVEVVRCKDCKHWHEETGWCYHHSHFVDTNGGFCHPWESTDWKMLNADDFCSYGERRNNATD